jgi:hypothetical protein
MVTMLAMILAATGSRVVVVTGPAPDLWPAAEQATREELELAGLEVFVVSGAARDERARRVELTTIANQEHAEAAIRLLRAPSTGAGQHLELWVVDRLTGKTLFREVDVPEGDAGARVVGVRVLEALRASLLELRLIPSAASLAAPMERLVASSPPGPGFRVGAEVGALITNELGLTGQLTVLGRRDFSRLGLEARFSTSLAPFSIDALRARALAQSVGVALGVFWTPLRSERWQLDVGPAAGVDVVWATGVEAPRTGVTTAATALARVGGEVTTHLTLTERVRLRLRLGGAARLPPLVVTFANEEVRRDRFALDVCFGGEFALDGPFR